MFSKLFYWFFNLGVKTAYAKDHTVRENLERYRRSGPSFDEHGPMSGHNALINIMEISGASQSEALEIMRTGVIPAKYATDRSTLRDVNGNRRAPGKAAYNPGGDPDDPASAETGAFAGLAFPRAPHHARQYTGLTAPGPGQPGYKPPAAPAPGQPGYRPPTPAPAPAPAPAPKYQASASKPAPTGGTNVSYSGGGGSTTERGGGRALTYAQAIAGLNQKRLAQAFSRGRKGRGARDAHRPLGGAEIRRIAENYLAGRISAQAAENAVKRITKWGPIRANEGLAGWIRQITGGRGGTASSGVVPAGSVGTPGPGQPGYTGPGGAEGGGLGGPAPVPAFANISTNLAEQQGLSDVVRSRALGSGVTPGFRPLLEQRLAQAQLPFLVGELSATSPDPVNSASPDAFRRYLDSISGNASLRLGDALGQAGSFLGQNFAGNDLRSGAQLALRGALEGEPGTVGTELFAPILSQVGQGLGRNFGIDMGSFVEEALRNSLSLTPQRFTSAEQFIGGLRGQGILDFLNRRF